MVLSNFTLQNGNIQQKVNYNLDFKHWMSFKLNQNPEQWNFIICSPIIKRQWFVNTVQVNPRVPSQIAVAMVQQSGSLVKARCLLWGRRNKAAFKQHHRRAFTLLSPCVIDAVNFKTVKTWGLFCQIGRSLITPEQCKQRDLKGIIHLVNGV